MPSFLMWALRRPFCKSFGKAIDFLHLASLNIHTLARLHLLTRLTSVFTRAFRSKETLFFFVPAFV